MNDDLLRLMRWWDFPIHLQEHSNRADDQDNDDTDANGDAVALEEALLLVVGKVLVAHGIASNDATSLTSSPNAPERSLHARDDRMNWPFS
jgi:hypothetical protein